MRFVVFKDKKGEWRWHLKAANHRIIADSGEGYKNQGDCLHGIGLVIGLEDSNVTIEFTSVNQQASVVVADQHAETYPK